MIFKRNKPAPRQEAVAFEPAVEAPSSEPSYIGRDTTIEGNISTSGEIHIEGELRGSVRAYTCLIDTEGQVNGGVSAQYVVVRGRVLGPITAAHVTIQKGAHVEGNVVHEGLSIEHGAFVMGAITQSNISESSILAPNYGTKLGNGYLPPRQEEDSDFDDSTLPDITPLKPSK